MTAAKTMPLPPPCGTMTVTYEFDRKVKIPVFNESALRSFAEEAQKKDAETIQELIGSLERVMSWINNWEPDFSEDADWRSDARDIRAAILKAKRGQE